MRLRMLGLITGLTLLAVLIRAPALDRFVTVDETLWLGRSANFYQAISSGDFANTYQFVHPGVPVMWLGTLGYLWTYPTYVDDVPQQIDAFRPPIQTTLQEQGRVPLDVLVALRLAKIIGEMLVVAFAFAFGIRLLGLWPATLGFALVLFDPFFIAQGRLLHVDSLTSAFALLSLVALCRYQFRGRRRRDLVVAGVAAGLAWLTRSPAVILIPWTGVILATSLWPTIAAKRPPGFAAFWRVARSFLIWLAISLAVTFALWPALWSDPLTVLGDVFGWALGAAQDGHEATLFFNGQIHDGDPGWYFYPVTFLWRTTPITLVGLLLVVVGLLAPRTRFVAPTLRAPILAMGLFALLFMLMMSVGAKKFDRYILPSYPPLDVIAGVGWFGVVSALARSRSRVIQFAGPALAGVIILAQVGLTIGARPYHLSYYNPLLGGAAAASNVMMLGWGEGFDQVAAFIDTDQARDPRPGGRVPVVRTTAWFGPADYFIPQRVRTAQFAPGMEGVLQWRDTDYMVTYVTMWQRDWMSQSFRDYFDAQEPVHTVRIGGADHARVYDLRDLPLPDFLVRDHHCAVNFGDRVRFVAVQPTEVEALILGSAVVTTVFTTRTPADGDIVVRLQLVTNTGQVVAETDQRVTPADATGLLTTATHQVRIPMMAPSGPYQIVLTVLDATTGDRLPATDYQTGASLGDAVRLTC